MSTEAAEAEAEAVEVLLRQVLIADAQVDHDIIRPQLPLRIVTKTRYVTHEVPD